MNETLLKRALQVGFLVVLIWILAAVAGRAPGASVNGPGFSARIGPRGKKHAGYRRRHNPIWVSSGMTSELVSSIGTNTPPVGWPGSVL